MLLLGNRLAYAQPQLTSTKERRSALPPQTRPPVKTNIWQCQANNIPNMVTSKFANLAWIQVQVNTKDHNRKTVRGQLMKQKLKLKDKTDQS